MVNQLAKETSQREPILAAQVLLEYTYKNLKTQLFTKNKYGDVLSKAKPTLEDILGWATFTAEEAGLLTCFPHHFNLSIIGPNHSFPR